jgi:hypothetical protein
VLHGGNERGEAGEQGVLPVLDLCDGVARVHVAAERAGGGGRCAPLMALWLGIARSYMKTGGLGGPARPTQCFLRCLIPQGKGGLCIVERLLHT